MDKITQAVKAKLEEESDEESLNVLPKAIDTVRKKVLICLYNSDFVCMPFSLLDRNEPC